MGDDMTDGTVRITQAQIYEELQGVKSEQAETNALLRQHIAVQDQHNAATTASVNSLIEKQARDRADLDRHELDITLLKTTETARKEHRTPWWVWITTGGTIIAAVGGGISVLVILNRMLDAYATVAP